MIKIDRLSKTYDKKSRAASQALYDISFELPDTGFVCIVGPSGCGKTSLLNAIGGLDTFDGGSVSTESLSSLRCGNHPTEEERSRSFGYIFQNYYLLPEYSAAYNIYLGLHSLELSHREKLERVMEALRAVDMERFARRAVGELSGGQQQRVAIARAIARRPKVIFADEPTGNLDEANTINICSLLRKISKNSLVVMVTHEEQTARFFADRIITLESGRLKSDSESWNRGSLSAGGNNIYTGDFSVENLSLDGVSLRLLKSEDAPPISLSVISQKDRVIIKLDDQRAVTLGKTDEPPIIIDGPRPVLKLENIEHEGSDIPWKKDTATGRAGKGLPFSMLVSEARHLLHGNGIQRFGTRLFLAVLTVLTLLAVGDYLMVSSLDPEDFITADSHILEIEISRGEALDIGPFALQDLVRSYMEHLDASGLAIDYVPRVPYSAEYSTSTFIQMGSVSVALPGFSYVPTAYFDPNTLVFGRSPERPNEVVVDRWVLDALLKKDGIIQNGISDVSYFLGKELNYSKKTCSLTIVGVSDCGEPAMFLDYSALASLGSAGSELICLSDLKQLFPGKYDNVSLSPEECIVITNNAGIDYEKRVGGVYTSNNRQSFIIANAIQEDTYASLVIADEALEPFIRAMISTPLYIYCGDKEAVKSYISAGLPEELEGKLQVAVFDRNTEAWEQYRLATSVRMNGRRIVTFTVIAVSMVMLYLLQRSRVQERIGLVAVYRLLGIPGRNLCTIFALECLFQSLAGTLPTAVLTWLTVSVLSLFPSISVSFLLPWYAVAAVYFAILLFHLLASLLPLLRLLRLPPARLAAKYDF